MLKGIHILLTYMCPFQCDHCFVYSGPTAEGTFTLNLIEQVLKEAKKINTIEIIYFEGGEPFLFYPLMVAGIKTARSMGFKTGVVTNAYFATSIEDACLWLEPLKEMETSDLSISDDPFHYTDRKDNPAQRALTAAGKLGLPGSIICIEGPTVKISKEGMPVVGGGTMFKGRAVEKLTAGLPLRPWTEFNECPHEDLDRPGRVHIDPYGNVHLCQGLSMGNIKETPLAVLIEGYHAGAHPICRELIKGGPALLTRRYKPKTEAWFVDACHCCYMVRRSLVDYFPYYLAPRQVYGLTAKS